MKKLLAVMGLGLAAAVLLSARERSRSRQWRRPAPADGDMPPAMPGRIPRAGTFPASPQKRAAQAFTARTAATPRPPFRPQEPAHPAQPARNAEEMLNSATRQQLLSVYGIGPVLADRIMQNRPYASAYDVVEKGIIPESIYLQLRKQLLDQHSA